MIAPCSCGESHPHEVAQRRTADDAIVLLRSDGAVLGLAGAIRGVPVARPRTVEAHRRALVAGWLLLGEACAHTRAELPELYAACREAARLDGLPGTARRLLRERRERPAPVPITWTVTRADRFGRAEERYGRLPRLGWPRLAVIDSCRGTRRYEVCAIERHDGRDVLGYDGMAFGRLDELYGYLRSVSALVEARR